jgi:hypothetical protein
LRVRLRVSSTQPRARMKVSGRIVAFLERGAPPRAEIVPTMIYARGSAPRMAGTAARTSERYSDGE